MKWNLRLAAANRGIWKASELKGTLAAHGLPVSAGKMSGLWSGNPASVKLDEGPGCHLRRPGLRDRRTAAARTREGHQARRWRAAPAGRRAGRWRGPRAARPGATTAAPCRRPEVGRSRSPARDLPRSCIDCLAWGVMEQIRCRACRSFRDGRVPQRECTGCGRALRVKNGYRPLGRVQLSGGHAWEGTTPQAVAALAAAGAKTGHHQLFFDRMAPRTGAGRRAARHAARGPSLRRLPGFSRYCRRRMPARPGARRPARPWPPRSASPTASPRPAGGPARSGAGSARDCPSRWTATRKARTSRGHGHCPRCGHGTVWLGHVAEVLRQAGMLDDDRRPAFDAWLDRKLDGVTGGIRRDVERWLRTLKDGGPRSRPRSIATVHSHLGKALPALSDWSLHYSHLREVTREDIQDCLRDLRGPQRHNALVALRSLFGFCLSAVCNPPQPRPRHQGRPAARHHRAAAAGPRRHRRRRCRCRHPGGPAHRGPGRCSSTRPAAAPSAPCASATPTQVAAACSWAGSPGPWTISPHACCAPGWRTAAPMARNRQPAPAHQRPDRPGHRAGQQNLGQRHPARPRRDHRGPARRPPARRSHGHRRRPGCTWPPPSAWTPAPPSATHPAPGNSSRPRPRSKTPQGSPRTQGPDPHKLLPGAEDADVGGVRGADVVTRKGPAAGVAAGLWW